MRYQFGLIFSVIAIFLGGCASVPQQSVSLSTTAKGAEAGRVGVAMTKLPKVDTFFPGANCLLCLAAASIANTSLTTHAKTLPYEDLPRLKADLANLLRHNGVVVTEIADDVDIEALPDFDSQGPNVARKNFSSLRAKYNIDRLVVINVKTLGYIRSYQAYIPSSEPKATLDGFGYMVNLKSNTYDWYKPVSVSKSADQSWDEPPKFPGLTNAYFQVLEIAKDSFLEPFAGTSAAGAPTAGVTALAPIAAGESAASTRR